MEPAQAPLAMGWTHAAFALSALLAGDAAAQTRPSVVGTILSNQSALASASGVYNTSTTPAGIPWDTYNYCNAPHVNAAHYAAPNVSGAVLQYLQVVQRHHKASARARVLSLSSFETML